MRLTTMLVLASAAVATFAPAASAAITAPPDWDQVGPDPSVTKQFTFAGGCIAAAQRPHRSFAPNRGTVASGGVWCFRRAQSVSVLTCTDIYAPNDVWSVSGLVDGWSWRPLQCTAAPDGAGVHGAGARDFVPACSTAFQWWPSNPEIRTEVVTQFTNARGQSFQTVDYSQPVTFSFPACSSGGGTYGGPV
jgi:hypothetical protein